MYENPTIDLEALCKSFAKLAFCSSHLIFTFLYAAIFTQKASEQFVSCIHISLVNFALHPTQQPNGFVWQSWWQYLCNL
jgi:uncharacterized membrane protein